MNSPTDEPQGSQTPRVLTAPARAWSEGPSATFLATSYGLTPDPWQALVLDEWLGVRDDGKWAAPQCGLAVPRQNGKNGALEVVELYKMVALGRRILHTAHEVKTARKAFARLAAFFENPRQFPELAALKSEIRRANGQEAVMLTNGGGVEFIARSKGSGRGFTVDDLVLDESQDLSDDEFAALLPTISAAPSGNPQTILIGTPPSPAMDGGVWARMRDTGLAGTSPRLAWMEWSCEGAIDLDDVANWRQANPGLGIRLNLDTIADERAVMDDETFARERLGMWASGSQLQVIPADLWASRATASPPVAGEIAYAIDISPDRTTGSIGVALAGESTTHLEVAAHGSCASGTAWLVDWIVERKVNKPVAVVIDARSGAASLIPDLQARGVKVTITNAQNMAQACGMFFDGVTAGTVTHFDQPGLNRALVGAKRRTIGTESGWGWNRKGDADITPLVAVTLALYGLTASRVGRKERTGRATFV